MFADQPSNADVIVLEGWALKLDLRELNESLLSRALNEMLTNVSYRTVVRHRARLYRDRPAHPLDTAVWWVEYVLRHQGARHMQSAALFLNWFQRNSYDVIAVLLAIGIGLGWMGKLSVGFVWRRLWWWRLLWWWRRRRRCQTPHTNVKRKSE